MRFVVSLCDCLYNLLRSTLTSKDIILGRSSTRVHAAPGGRSSICFGDYTEPKKVENKENVRYSPFNLAI